MMGGAYLKTLFMALLMLGSVSFYYKVGESEYTSGLLLGGLSLLVWLATWLVMAWGPLGCILGQVGIFAVLTAVNIIRDRPDSE